MSLVGISVQELWLFIQYIISSPWVQIALFLLALIVGYRLITQRLAFQGSEVTQKKRLNAVEELMSELTEYHIDGIQFTTEFNNRPHALRRNENFEEYEKIRRDLQMQHNKIVRLLNRYGHLVRPEIRDQIRSVKDKIYELNHDFHKTISPVGIKDRRNVDVEQWAKISRQMRNEVDDMFASLQQDLYEWTGYLKLDYIMKPLTTLKWRILRHIKQVWDNLRYIFWKGS